MSSHLIAHIEQRSARVGVVGLGYVGLPLACTLANEGFQVSGFDRNVERVTSVARGQSFIEGDEPELDDLLASALASGRLVARADPTPLADADVVLIAVDTPVEATHQPDLRSLRSAIRSVAERLRPGSLVVVESTVAPGTMDGVVVPLLEEVSHLKLNDGFLLGHCPERVMPGRLLRNLRTMPRVCGGSSPEAISAMLALYGAIVRGKLETTDLIGAEIVKTGENAFRDVNIAFANELALLCEHFGADVWRIRELINMSPGRNVLEPGSGVGGHCIPKDPWLLVANSGTTAVNLIPAARRVNDGMPKVVVDVLEQLMSAYGQGLSGATIAVLGYSYLANSGDTRNSPSVRVGELLAAAGAAVRIHDPYVQPYQGTLGESLGGADAAVVMVGHDAYRTLRWTELASLMRRPIVLDTRNVLDPSSLMRAGVTYRCLGRPGTARGLGSSTAETS